MKTFAVSRFVAVIAVMLVTSPGVFAAKLTDKDFQRVVDNAYSKFKNCTVSG